VPNIGHGGLNMKAMKKNDMGVSPVIAVILMVAITVVLAGVVFLWAQSFTNEAGGTVRSLNVKGSIDAGNSELQLEVISGTITWADYKILVDGSEVSGASVNETSSSAGETAHYYSHGSFSVAQSYNVKIVDIAENKVVWEDDIIASA